MPPRFFWPDPTAARTDLDQCGASGAAADCGNGHEPFTACRRSLDHHQPSRARRLFPRPVRRERHAAGEARRRGPARPCLLAAQLPSRGPAGDLHPRRAAPGLPGVRGAVAARAAPAVGGAEEIGAIPQPALPRPHGLGSVDPGTGRADPHPALQPEQRQRGCRAGDGRPGGPGRAATRTHARLRARPGARRLRVWAPDVRRHARELPGAAARARAEGVPGRAARRRRARHRLARGRLVRVQPRTVGWHRRARTVAGVARCAARGDAPTLGHGGAGAADRAARAGRFLRRASAVARAGRARADHRALLVEQGPETPWPRPRAADAAARARHAARPRCARRHAAAVRARAPAGAARGRGAGHHRVRHDRPGGRRGRRA